MPFGDPANALPMMVEETCLAQLQRLHVRVLWSGLEPRPSGAWRQGYGEGLPTPGSGQ
jgi:hypothetical protein